MGLGLGFRLSGLSGLMSCCFKKWVFPKIRGTLFWGPWGPYNKDPTI